MQLTSRFRAGLVALAVGLGLSFSSAAHADGGTLQISVIKGGWFIGGSGGRGEFIFHGRRFPVTVGGLAAGLVFGASHAYLSGRVSRIRSPYDIAGVYGAVGVGAAIGGGVRAIVLSNQNGALLELSGPQIGLMVNADFDGLALSIP
jgi:hypothetical protein